MEENPFAQFDAEAAATPSDAIVSSTPDMSAPPVDATTQADANPFAQFDEPTTSNPYPAEYAAAVDEFNAFKTKTGEASPEKLQAAWNTLLVRHGIKEQWELSAKGRADHQAVTDKIAADEAQFGANLQIDNGLRALARGIPLVGPYADEAQAGLQTGLDMAADAAANVTGIEQLRRNADYDRALMYQRERDRKFDEEHPYISTGLQIAGGVAGTIAGAKATPSSLNALKNFSEMTKAGKVATGMGVGAGVGAVEGFGRGEGSAGDRAEQAAKESAGNFFIGGLVPIAAPLVSKVADWTVGTGSKLVQELFPRLSQGAKELNVSDETIGKLATSYAEDQNTGALIQATPGDMLLNRGDRLSAAAEVIANSPGEAGNIIKSSIRQQQAGEGARVKSVVDEVIGRDAGRVANQAVIDSERKAAGKMFEVAKASDAKIDLGPAQQRLAGMIEEADGPIAESLAKAQKLKTLRPDAKGPFTAEQVHRSRMALDDMIEKAGDPTTSAGRNAKNALKDVRAMLDEQLKGNVPGWKEADAAYAIVAKKKQAILDGRSVFSRGYGSPDELKAELDAMDPAVRNAFKIGARDAISELMGSARKEANAAARELLDKGWNAEKLTVLLGKEKASRIADTLQAVSRRQAQTTRIVGNSRTAARQAERQAFPVGEAAGANIDAFAQRGATGNALRLLAKLGDAALNDHFSKKGQKIAEETARLLTTIGMDQERVARILEAESTRLGRQLNAKEVVKAIRGAVLGVGVSRGTDAGANVQPGSLVPEL